MEGGSLANFERIKQALEYIDSHLDEPMSLEKLAKQFYLSPYYFHRIFTLIVGKAIAAHIRDRRLMYACIQLVSTNKSILNIGLDCGFNSAQSFSRTFRDMYGLSPSDYRKQEFTPIIVTVDEMIMKFTNRLRGGIFVNPKIIKKGAMTIAGVSGDGNKTGEVWDMFERLSKEKPVTNKISDNGYEVRLYEKDSSTVHVGLLVSNTTNNSGYKFRTLPASEYASFDIYVAKGYDSENSAMTEWIKSN